MKLHGLAVLVWGSFAVLLGTGLIAKLVLPLLFSFWHPARAPRPVSPTPLSASLSVAQPASASPDITPITPILPTPAPARPQPTWLAVPPGAVATLPLKLDVGALPYESALLTITHAPVPDGVKAQALFDLLPQVPEESMASTAEQAAALLRDRDYARLALPWIVSPKTHGAVLGALFADLMERPDAVALPTLVEIAKTPDHPFAPSAHDNLTLLVGHDYGIDWPAWDKAVLQKLNTPAPAP